MIARIIAASRRVPTSSSVTLEEKEDVAVSSSQWWDSPQRTG